MLPNHHFLPAGYIGGFSESHSGSMRNRPMEVFRRSGRVRFRANAAYVAKRRGLYTVKNADGTEDHSIDQTWTGSEALLPQSITALISSQEQLDAKLWIKSLVPFITGLFVRGPEFTRRFEERIPFLRSIFDDQQLRDNSNHARFIELQRLYAPVMAARWEVIHNTSTIPLITNDVGYCLMQHPDGSLGYAIPLRPEAVLALTRQPRERGVRLIWNGNWIIEGIAHHSIDHVSVKQLNATITQTCIEEVYSPCSMALDSACDTIKERVDHHENAPGPQFLIDPSVPLRATEMLYFKVFSVIESPGTPGLGFYLR